MNRYVSLLIAPALAGCALPEPAPIWRTLVPVNPYVIDGSLAERRHRVFDQDLTADRARRFVHDKLPSTPALLWQELAADGFSCQRQTDGAAVLCAYAETRPPAACFASIRVAVSAVFPSSPPTLPLTDEHVRVTASVSEDSRTHDHRSCMPL
jgi:hypothetical protein